MCRPLSCGVTQEKPSGRHYSWDATGLVEQPQKLAASVSTEVQLGLLSLVSPGGNEKVTLLLCSPQKPARKQFRGDSAGLVEQPQKLAGSVST